MPCVASCQFSHVNLTTESRFLVCIWSSSSPHRSPARVAHPTYPALSSLLSRRCLSIANCRLRPCINMAASSSLASAAAGADAAETLRRNRILSSKLYLDEDIPRTKLPVIYSPSYDITFLGIEKLHPFDSSKWGRICHFLSEDQLLDSSAIVEPLEASKDDLLVVHSESYLKSLNSSLNVSNIVEVPPVAVIPNCLVQKKLLYPFRKQVGGTVLAAKLATERGWAINVGGGFHHCSADRGGGFCAYADISICIQFAFVRLNISRVMIIDLDAHQGNGHELDFAHDRRVYILDMYNAGIYPFDVIAKKYISQKIELLSGTKTDEYLELLGKALEVDPDGVITRDEMVFRFAKEKNVPLLMVTSGGYMKSNARVIANSISNLSKKNLINLHLRRDGVKCT